jgi:hypothetical protein
VLLTGQTGTHRSDRSNPPVKLVWRCCSSVFGSSVLALWINQGTQWFSGEPPETPRTRCSLHQSPPMTRLPRSPGSTLVLRLNQETVHDCRMDLPGPTTSVGTRTDYSVGPWDYPACATRHLKAWGTRTAEE